MSRSSGSQEEGVLAGTLDSREEAAGFIPGIGVHEEWPSNCMAVGEHNTTQEGPFHLGLKPPAALDLKSLK